MSLICIVFFLSVCFVKSKVRIWRLTMCRWSKGKRPPSAAEWRTTTTLSSSCSTQTDRPSTSKTLDVSAAASDATWAILSETLSERWLKKPTLRPLSMEKSLFRSQSNRMGRVVWNGNQIILQLWLFGFLFHAKHISSRIHECVFFIRMYVLQSWSCFDRSGHFHKYFFPYSIYTLYTCSIFRDIWQYSA